MNELSLFSGAGGGLLATKHLLGWTTIGYIEVDQYCQAVLAQRIEDGYLDPAPIFGDIRQLGWTDLKPLVKAKFQEWLRLHGRSYQE